MKPKNEASKNYVKPEEKKTIGPELPKAQPVKAAQAVHRVKCVWSGTVKVLSEKTPSGKAYSFQPQEVKALDSKEDALYLVSISNEKSGCCGGSGTPRRYFELV